MSLLRKLLYSAPLVAVLGLSASPLAAQDEHVNDFFDPFCGHPTDYFEPIHCECPDYGRTNTGWFFTYDRLKLYGSRPSEAPGGVIFEQRSEGDWLGFGTPSIPETIGGTPVFAPNMANQQLFAESANNYDGDDTPGNRFDFGYMGEDGKGIWFVARKMNNPGVRLRNAQIDRNDNGLDDLLGDPFPATFVTLNAFNFYGFEVNRVWRMPPTAKGIVLEPFVGPRYVRIRDHADRRDVFIERNLPVFDPGLANLTLTVVDRDILQDLIVTTDNNLWGGQVGLRSSWRRGRWVVSSDVRGFTFYNLRERTRIYDTEGVAEVVRGNYDAIGDLAGTTVVIDTTVLPSGQVEETDESGEFAYGGELRLETAFELTKKFAVRAGAEVIIFADGVGRGLVDTDDHFRLMGFSLGFAFNR
jgi:hypothetical protein